MRNSAKDTAAAPMGAGGSCDAGTTGGAAANIPHVQAACEQPAISNSSIGLAVGIVIIAMALRPGIASIGPLLPLIRPAFSLSHASASLLATIPALLMGSLALPTPWLARRFGRNRVLLASLVLLFVSMVARALAPNVLLLLLTTAGVGAGIAISGTLFAGVIKARFPAKVARMMSLYATSLALSTTVSAAATGPIASFAIARGFNGWRVGTGVWSPITLLAILAAMAISRGGIGHAEPAAKKAKAGPRLPFANGAAWRAALFFACDNFLFFGLLAWTSPIYLDYGMPPTSAGLVLVTYTAAFTAGIPVFGSLSRAHDRRGWLLLCAALAVAGTLGLAWAPLMMPYVWIGTAAFGVGGGFTLGMTLPLDNTHDAEGADSWNAFVMTIGYLIAAGGPLLVGALRDVTGTFRASALLMFAVALVMLALTPFLAPQKLDLRSR